MNKYMPLAEYLSKSGKQTVTLSFKEIEAKLGFPLPKSAKYRAFWENAQKHRHVQSDAWMSAGYTAKVKLEKQRVIFQKTHDPAPGNAQPKSKSFEELAREAMSAYFGKLLRHRKKEGWAKLFALVSEDYRIVGEIKCLSMGGAPNLPPTRASIISELVWMLEKTRAEKLFIVFGKDRRVPQEWLRRYGKLADSVEFYFLSESGNLSKLH